MGYPNQGYGEVTLSEVRKLRKYLGDILSIYGFIYMHFHISYSYRRWNEVE
jgi:hypothetical protein